MSFDDLLAAELPDPRDDEPEALRQDIIDELADHLACSVRRELLSGADAESARRRALEQFGNPAAIAARLWLDAMKGKIMSQRILVTACLILAISSLALIGFSWVQWDRMNRVQAEQLAASQAMQSAMLKQMETLAKAAEAAQASRPALERGSDWIPLRLHLTSGTADGPPVPEVAAELSRGANASGPERRRESDSQGIVDFGVIQPGDWKVDLVYNADGQTWTLQHVLSVPLGGPIEKTIICPRSPRELPVKIRVQWPAELADRGLFLVANFAYSGTNLQPDLDWMPSTFPRQNRFKAGQRLLLDTSGHLTGIPSSDVLWTLDSLSPFDGSSSRRRSDAHQDRPGRVFASLGELDLGKAAERLEFLEGRYRLTELELVRPSPRLKSSQLNNSSFEVLARTAIFLTNLRQLPEIPVDREHLDKMIRKSSFISTRGLTLHRLILNHKPKDFMVSSGQSKTWTIELPPEIVDAALSALKQDEDGMALPPETLKPTAKDKSKPKG